jgi:hypothetical protein
MQMSLTLESFIVMTEAAFRPSDRVRSLRLSNSRHSSVPRSWDNTGLAGSPRATDSSVLDHAIFSSQDRRTLTQPTLMPIIGRS